MDPTCPTGSSTLTGRRRSEGWRLLKNAFVSKECCGFTVLFISNTAQFQLAFGSYAKAASMTKDRRLRNEYRNSAQRMRTKIELALNERLGARQTMKKGEFQPIQRLLTLELEGFSYKLDSAVFRHCYVSKRLKERWEVPYNCLTAAC